MSMQWTQLLSRRRLGVKIRSGEDALRTDFQRDYDRIVFSSAFRRMQDKTQVFPLSGSDYVRTRLTHSLEVSSVGRTLGSKVGARLIERHGLDQAEAADVGAIVAAACLAHDIGNPPFGHFGEDSIRLWFSDTEEGRLVIEQLNRVQRSDFLEFEGNAQGFRIISRLQNPDNFGGMQLTAATLGAFTKYPRASSVKDELPPQIAFKKFGFFQDDASMFSEAADYLGLTQQVPGAWQRHPLAFLVEAADDICYRIIDVEDAYQMGLLGFDETRDLLAPLVDDKAALDKLNHIRRPKERVEYLRAKAIGRMVDQVEQVFMKHEDSILAGTFKSEMLDMIESADKLQALKTRAAEKIYIARPVVEIEAAGFEVLGGLLGAFVNTVNDIALRGKKASPRSRMLVHLIPEQFVGENMLPDKDLYRRVLRMTDFVSGMTDSYAVSLFKKITGISLPGR